MRPNLKRTYATIKTATRYDFPIALYRQREVIGVLQVGDVGADVDDGSLHGRIVGGDAADTITMGAGEGSPGKA